MPRGIQLRALTPDIAMLGIVVLSGPSSLIAEKSLDQDNIANNTVVATMNTLIGVNKISL